MHANLYTDIVTSFSRHVQPSFFCLEWQNLTCRNLRRFCWAFPVLILRKKLRKTQGRLKILFWTIFQQNLAQQKWFYEDHRFQQPTGHHRSWKKLICFASGWILFDLFHFVILFWAYNRRLCQNYPDSRMILWCFDLLSRLGRCCRLKLDPRFPNHIPINARCLRKGCTYFRVISSRLFSVRILQV